MIKMSTEHGELPMEGTLCVFKFNGTNGKELFMNGSLIFKKHHFRVKRYGAKDIILASKFTHFHYILNENGGFYFIK